MEDRRQKGDVGEEKQLGRKSIEGIIDSSAKYSLLAR